MAQDYVKNDFLINSLNLPYANTVNDMERAIDNAVLMYDGSTPVFVGIQGCIWNVKVPDFKTVADYALSKDKNVVLVRADQYMMLYRQSVGLSSDRK